MPPIPEKIDEFTFGAGLKEHDDHWLQAEGFTVLEHCIQDKAGAITKLPGYSEMSDAFISNVPDVPHTAVGGEKKLISVGDQIGCVANGYVYANDGTQWILQGRCSPWVADQRTVVDLAPRKSSDGTRFYETVRHDCCRSGEWIFSAFEHWETNEPYYQGRLCVVVTHVTTGRTIFQMVTPDPTPTYYSVNSPRLVPWDNNGNAILVYRAETSGDVFATLVYRKVSPTELGPEISLAFTTDTAWDCAADPGNAAFFIASHPSSTDAYAQPKIDLRRYAIGASTLSIEETVTVTVAGVPIGIGLTALVGPNRLTVGYSQLINADTIEQVRAFCRQATSLTSVVWADQLLRATSSFSTSGSERAYRTLHVAVVDLGPTNASACIAWYDPNGEQAGYGGEFQYRSPTTRMVRVSSDGVIRQVTAAARVRLRSRPFWDGTRVCHLAEHVGTATGVGTSVGNLPDRNRYYVVLGIEVTDDPVLRRPVPMAHFAIGAATTIEWGHSEHTLTGYSSPYRDPETGSWTVQSLERDPGTLRLRLRAYELKQYDSRIGISVELGGQAYFVGALMCSWDGLRSLEAAWLAEPVIELITAVSAPSGVGSGTRYHAVTFARTGAAGELLRSHPSRIEKSTISSNTQNYQLRISPYGLSLKHDNDHLDMWVEIWRTKAGEAAPLYLAHRYPLDVNRRDPMVLTDNATDAQLPTRFEQTLPYDETDGAEIPNDALLSPVHLCQWRNRIWLTDGDQIQYSKEGLPSRQAEFSLVQTLPRGMQQRLTAVAALGDTLAVFTEEGTAYVYGDAPAANGTGSTLTGPIDVETDHGCIDPAGLVRTETGLIVRSRSGIQALSVKRSYSYVGAGIERVLEQYPRVQDASFQRSQDRVWFVLRSLNFNGIFAILDLQHGTWSTAFDIFLPVSVRTVNDVHYWASGYGTFMTQAPGSFLVGTQSYYQRVRTVWFKTGGALAEIRFKRAWLLAQQIGPSGLSISCGYDFEEGFPHYVFFTAAELAAIEGAPGNVIIVRIPSSRQRCHAVRFEIAEFAGEANDTAGLRFVAMRLLTALRRAKGPLKAVRNANTGLKSA